MATVGPLQDSPQSPSAHALDNVQAMMNLTLVTCGRFLNEQLTSSGATPSLMLVALTRTVPVAQVRFHTSLDQLENEIYMAQTVLRRDLALLQADRRQKREAARAERKRLAAESSAKQKELLKQEELTVKGPRPAANPEPSVPATSNSRPAPPAAKPLSLNRDADDAPPPLNTAVPPAARDPLFDPTPTTANPQDTEFDFDAIFGDTALDAPGDTEHSAQADVDMDATPTAAPDLNFSLDDQGPSLLRGLEDFAKSSSDDASGAPSTNMDLDFPIPDLPEINSVNVAMDQQPHATKSAEPATTQAPATVAAGENPNLLDTMMTDNLDDLFTFEDNPDTQFDDAFFGLE
ncbi:hypothetical protein BDV95DRAFT_672627 [Massariosphaeria phaeospora]|uniref:Uncharacterized protein n=1 Tax=Massariosphaeria phaeospora TaxID=100035 RepID=A0A7C8I593_9PLEO|nr:hypothetical protein BDV95DRAFT_672627 [Massariosphaeria phaeospora]